jgi:hypothetical protein
MPEKFKNLRIDVVYRTGEKDWAGTGRYLQLRAFTGIGEGSMMGPEVPMESDFTDVQIKRIMLNACLMAGGPDTDHPDHHHDRPVDHIDDQAPLPS